MRSHSTETEDLAEGVARMTSEPMGLKHAYRNLLGKSWTLSITGVGSIQEGMDDASPSCNLASLDIVQVALKHFPVDPFLNRSPGGHCLAKGCEG